MFLYRDPIHKDIEVDCIAGALIDTPEFQRLSKIKQLGFAELVYRGANHIRFAHSLGTYWIVRSFFEIIAKNHRRLVLDHPGKLLSDDF
jgi:HD superfamily phosphohydrolase